MKPLASLLAAVLLLAPPAAEAEALDANPEAPGADAEAPGPEVQLPGVPIAGFGEGHDWYEVQDSVMGGRSEGDVAVDGGVLTFSGEINTNGGGFYSAYHPLTPGVLADADHVLLRVKAVDDRPYRVNFRDRSPGRRDRVLHRFDLPITEPGAWQTVEVKFEDLVPSVRGDPADRPPFDPASAVEIGLILNDTGDGAFELQVSRIHAVAGE